MDDFQMDVLRALVRSVGMSTLLEGLHEYCCKRAEANRREGSKESEKAWDRYANAISEAQRRSETLPGE